MSDGILMVGFGHPNYVNMAVNLAASIRYRNNDIQIALLTNSTTIKAVSAAKLFVFNQIIEIDPAEYTIQGKPHYGFAKLKLYDWTPFERTAFIDVDSLAGKQFDAWQLLSEDKFPFWVYNTEFINKEKGKGNISYWADFSAFKDTFIYEGTRIPSRVQSSMLIFDKSQKSFDIFESAKVVHNWLLANGRGKFTSWYNTVPDELCFALALGMTGHEPKVIHNLIHFVFKGVTVGQRASLMNANAIVTFPSAKSTLYQTAKDLYDAMAVFFQREAKIKDLYVWRDKGAFVKLNTAQKKSNSIQSAFAQGRRPEVKRAPVQQGGIKNNAPIITHQGTKHAVTPQPLKVQIAPTIHKPLVMGR